MTIYHGDCLEIMPKLPKVDLVLTDPPYGINWKCNYGEIMHPSKKAQGGQGSRIYPRIIGDDKPFNPTPFLNYPKVILFGANHFLEYLKCGSILVWYKRNSVGFLANAEAAWMNKGSGVHVYCEPVEKMQKSRVHPTQKPIGLMKWCIEKSNSKGLILDPFLGSGTTAVAAKQLNRKCIGIEIEEKYCEIAVKRCSQEVLELI